MSAACQKYNPAELVNCEKAAMNVHMNGQSTSLKIKSSTLLRTESLSRSFKLLSLEAYIDTMKVVMNIADGPYPTAGLANDSLQLKTYSYSRKAGADTSGRVVLGIKDRFYVTDSAAVTITEVDVAARTITGTYYIQTVNPVREANGAFTKVCYLSIK
ncbi:hypothetical protein DLD77_07970 [Chitinophaga alhagiae]|uniref:Uncharacterized protein n=1 Tax=Chitinophaga alhagiae TaxID=2203219 RepID=A0ABM6WCN4_9BACT|nr:hypothetical protein DLD77_07970 [Chitinophaga alhagiae]